MARTAVTIGFSVPPEIAEKVERMATLEGKSKSELFRDMVRVYSVQRELEIMEELVTYGRSVAESRGRIDTEEDIVRFIHEMRAEDKRSGG